jgi:hypothetical protein
MGVSSSPFGTMRPYSSAIYVLLCVFENPLPGHVVFLEYMSNPLQATTTTTQCYNDNQQQRLVIGSYELGKLVYVAKHDVVDYTHTIWKSCMYTLEACCPGGCVDAVQLIGRKRVDYYGGGQYRYHFWLGLEFGSLLGLCSLQIHPGRL